MSLLPMERVRDAILQAESVRVRGRVTQVKGVVVEALLPRVAVGTACEIQVSSGRSIAAEVVGFDGAKALLVPFGEVQGIGEGCAVVPRAQVASIPVGEALLGRVVDAAMQPLDGQPPPRLPHRQALNTEPPPAMARRRISRIFVTGIRAIDGFLTLGEGQRIGVMAAPGVGKSSLLGMLARSSEADVIVVGLVGERGREVREFVERDLGSDGLARSVVVVATGEKSPLVRVRAAMAATSVAEYFRGQGRRVLLLVDSLSRVAMAQREIGLAAGEPPATRGYPPSVFALIPRLLERAGNDRGPGSITALYTVLVDGEDHGDPVVESVRATLDGHIHLSRRLAARAHWPAIDVSTSVSRCMSDVVDASHRRLAERARELLAAYEESADLIEVGAYAPGSNPRVDAALACLDPLLAFLRQRVEERTPLPETLALLERIVAAGTSGGAP
ncbi:MAG: FliI/YscN family ATPase [Deltaproteobacteria bacterium]|nr:MAG: FliI/YscN family ATPase [Deltaproteobacteria bacterium]